MRKAKPKRCFGQNFLCAAHIVDQIIHGFAVQPHDHVLEIGPGQAALTKPLLALPCARLAAVEVDRQLVANLKHHFGDALQLFEQDFLTFHLEDWLASHQKARLLGNLPYNIATAIIMHCLRQLDYIQDMHFMLQKEVAQRLCAKPGTSSYGRLSVRLQVVCQAQIWLEIPPDAFYPQPKVQSAMVRIRPLSSPPSVDITSLELVLSRAFTARRKRLSNALSSLFSTKALLALDIDPKLRPDALDVMSYVRLANALHQCQ